jgi:hypothetical protein
MDSSYPERTKGNNKSYGPTIAEILWYMSSINKKTSNECHSTRTVYILERVVPGWCIRRLRLRIASTKLRIRQSRVCLCLVALESELLTLLCRWHFVFAKFGRLGERNGLPCDDNNMCPVCSGEWTGRIELLLRFILLTDMINKTQPTRTRSSTVQICSKGVNQRQVSLSSAHCFWLDDRSSVSTRKRRMSTCKLYVTFAWSEEERAASMYQASKWDLILVTTQGKERERAISCKI